MLFQKNPRCDNFIPTICFVYRTIDAPMHQYFHQTLRHKHCRYLFYRMVTSNQCQCQKFVRGVCDEKNKYFSLTYKKNISIKGSSNSASILIPIKFICVYKASETLFGMRTIWPWRRKRSASLRSLTTIMSSYHRVHWVGY